MVEQAEPLHATLPAGVPPGPATVAVNTKVPPVEIELALFVTVVVEVARPTLALSKPELTL